jgi:hypothetical protein
MDPATIIAAIQALASLVQEGVKLYNDSNTVLSETDTAAIHAALLKAEEATAALRPKVDAALEAAAQN